MFKLQVQDFMLKLLKLGKKKKKKKGYIKIAPFDSLT